MYRGEIWWGVLPRPVASEPGYNRPVLIVQEDTFLQSNINTVIIAILTSNLRLANSPGNVMIPKGVSGLSKDSVVNVSQILTVNKTDLIERIGVLPASFQDSVDEGLRTVLYL